MSMSQKSDSATGDPAKLAIDRNSRESYNAYMKNYMKEYRKRQKEAK